MGNGECSTNEDSPGPCFASTRWHKAGVGALLGGATGGLLGLVFGGLAGSREIYGDPYAPRVTAAVAPGLAAASASWSF